MAVAVEATSLEAETTESMEEVVVVDRVAKTTDFETARERIGELERKIGQQQIELDFFRLALRRIGEARRPSDAPGVKASTL